MFRSKDPAAQLHEIIAALKPTFGRSGLSTKRSVDEEEVQAAVAAIKGAKRHVRAYSLWGFVPNSYKSRCSIQYVNADLDQEKGEWVITTGWTSAQRSGGNGNLLVVQ